MQLEHLAAGDVVGDRAVGHDADTAAAADLRPQLVHPAQWACGDDDDRHAQLLHAAEDVQGALAEQAFVVEQGAVEIGGHETGRCVIGAGQ